MAADLIARFNVKAGGPDAAARSLSGGNLQKFIVGREIDARPKLLIVSQPTWGVDVGRRRRSGANCWPCATPAAPCWWSARNWTNCSRSATAWWSSRRAAVALGGHRGRHARNDRRMDVGTVGRRPC
jgi:hypothetical protein